MFKEIIDSGKYPAKELAHYFNIEPSENLLGRTYCVISNQKYTTMITGATRFCELGVKLSITLVNSQKTRFFSGDRTLKEPIPVLGFSISQNRVAPMITEKFPESYFLKNF